MRAPATDRLKRRARTDWRRLLAWALLVGAVSASLYFGFSAHERAETTHTLLVKRPPPCTRLKNGKPSAGCRRVAALVAEQCRLTPILCAPLVQVIVHGWPGRRLVREALRAERARRVGHGGFSGGRRTGSSAPQGAAPAPNGGSSPGAPGAPGGGGPAPAPAPAPAPPAPVTPPSPPSPVPHLPLPLPQVPVPQLPPLPCVQLVQRC